MRDFMIGNELGKVFLAGRGKAGALLRFRREEGKSRNIEEAGPSLAKGSRNLRDTQIVKRKWPGESFVKMNRKIDFLSELL